LTRTSPRMPAGGQAMTQTPEEIAADIMDQAYRGDAEATKRRDIALAIRQAEERGAAQERERLRAGSPRGDLRAPSRSGWAG
jgi:hypothetical protein